MTKRKRTRKPTPTKQATKKPVQKRSKTTVGLTILNNQQWHIIILLALSFILYANTLTHSHTQDDAIVLVGNSFVKKGIEGIPDILTYDTFRGFFGFESNLVSGGRYRPLSLVTFAIEHQLFGENLMISHLVNILLYGLTGVLLYLLVLQFFNPKGRRSKTQAYFIAFVTAVLFIAHPIHTEAIANIKGRDEIMSLLASLGATYLAFRAYHQEKPIQLLWAAVIFFLGLLSKENTVTFLAVIPLALYCFTQATIRKIATYSVPFIGAFVLFWIIRTMVLGDASSISGETTKELMNNPYVKWNGTTYIDFTTGEKFATIMMTLGIYLKLLIFPHPLTHDYYPRHIEVMTFGDWEVMLTLLIYLAMVGYTIWRLPKKAPVAFGIITYIATLSIVSNIVFPIGTNMAERFIFMPSVGFCLVAALLLYQLIEKVKIKTWKDLGITLPILGVILVLFSLKTITRNFAWKDNYTLFATDIRTSTNSAKLNNAMGGETIAKAGEETDPAKQKQMLLDAIRYLEKARSIHPTYANTYVLMGNAHFRLNEYEKAIEFYDYVLGFTGAGATDHKNALKNKAFTYFTMGERYGEQQNWPAAISAFNQAIQLGKADATTYGQLGSSYGNAGQLNNAIAMFKKVLELEPNQAQAHLFLGQAYQQLGDATQSKAYFQKAYELDPKLKPE